MTITLTPEQTSIAEWAAAQRNASRPDDAWTAEQWAANVLASEIEAQGTAMTSAARAALVPIADALLAAPSSTRNEILSDVRTKLGL